MKTRVLMTSRLWLVLLTLPLAGAKCPSGENTNPGDTSGTIETNGGRHSQEQECHFPLRAMRVNAGSKTIDATDSEPGGDKSTRKRGYWWTNEDDSNSHYTTMLLDDMGKPWFDPDSFEVFNGREIVRDGLVLRFTDEKPDQPGLQAGSSPKRSMPESFPVQGRIASFGHEEHPRLRDVLYVVNDCRMRGEDCSTPLKLRVPRAVFDVALFEALGSVWSELFILAEIQSGRSSGVVEKTRVSTNVRTARYGGSVGSWEGARAHVSAGNAVLRRYRSRLREYGSNQTELKIVEMGIAYNNGCVQRLKRRRHCLASNKAGVHRDLAYRTLGASEVLVSSTRPNQGESLTEAIAATIEIVHRLVLTFALDALMRDRVADGGSGEWKVKANQVWKEALSEAEERLGRSEANWKELLKREDLYYEVTEINDDEVVVQLSQLVEGTYVEIWDLERGIVMSVLPGQDREELSKALEDHEGVSIVDDEGRYIDSESYGALAEEVDDNVAAYRFRSLDEDEDGDEKKKKKAREQLLLVRESYAVLIPVKWTDNDECKGDQRLGVEMFAVASVVEALEAWQPVSLLELDCEAGEVTLSMLIDGQPESRTVEKRETLSQIFRRRVEVDDPCGHETDDAEELSEDENKKKERKRKTKEKKQE